MNALTEEERAAGWRLLFDGKTTSGWRGFRQTTVPPEWQVADEALTLRKSAAAGEPGKLGTGIVTEEQWGDFELALEWKLEAGGNSGIFYRVSEKEDLPHRTGPEMQILDDERHPDARHGHERHTGACYDLYAPAKKVAAPVGEWNHARIVVEGERVEHWLNGEKIVAYELGSADWRERVRQSKFRDLPGYGREREGHILLQDHEHPVAFRNIRIRPLLSESAGGSAGVFLWSADGLAAVRRRIGEGDPSLAPALDSLRGDADRALAVGPLSVMDKTHVPPSGDKHDYRSVGPYWWPDPTKPDGLPYIRRDGETNPEREAGSTDRAALGRLVSAAETLALAGYLTGHEPYAEHAARLLRVWFLDPATKMNPNLNYGQAIPGRVEGRGIGIIDTLTLAPLTDAIELLRPSRAWSEADHGAMIAWYAEYLEWLLTSPLGKEEADQHNNHGTWYDVQVARFALFVGKPDLAKRVLEEARDRRIAPQIEPDGRQPHELARTKAFSYSVMNLKGMFDLAAMGERLGVDLWHFQTPDGRGLRRALDFLAPYADPANTWPYAQIGTPPDYALSLAPLLRRGARAYNDGGYEALLGKASPEALAAHRLQLTYALP